MIVEGVTSLSTYLVGIVTPAADSPTTVGSTLTYFVEGGPSLVTPAVYSPTTVGSPLDA